MDKTTKLKLEHSFTCLLVFLLSEDPLTVNPGVVTG